MNNEVMLPNYKKSILNVISSILKKYNVNTEYSELLEIKDIISKDYDNIVLVVLDGMGTNILDNNSPEGIFNRNKKCNITSVFPTTTTAGMTSYYSGKAPIETAWIGWTQYFKEYGKYIDVLSEIDDSNGQKIKVKGLSISDIIGYKNIYEQICEKNPELAVCEIVPSYCNKKTEITINADNIEELCAGVLKFCTKKKNEKKFIFAYSDNPDKIIHKKGCYSDETKKFITNTESQFKKLINNLKGTNTLMLISADHGHNDIKDKVSILELSRIEECLIMPPFLESRMISFFVKEEKKKIFEEEFNKRFKEKYILYNKKDFLNSKLMGNGKPHRKIDDFIGNYIAIAISDLVIVLENYFDREIKGKYEKKSTHSGLTRNEMEVPLIIFEIKS